MNALLIVERILALLPCGTSSWGMITRRGRLLLALPRDRSGALRGLKLYQPQRALARVFVSCLRLLTVLGLHRLLPECPQRAGRLVQFTPPLPEIDGRSVSILMGSSEHKIQRAVVSYRAAMGWEVAKISFGASGHSNLQQEAHVLQEIGSHERGIPCLLGLHQSEEMTVLRMPYLTGSPLARGYTAEALTILHQWISSAPKRSICEFPEWGDMKSALLGCKGGAFALHKLEVECLHPVIRHGDFTRWNLLGQGKKDLMVIDWEWAHSEGMPGLDLVHFLLQDIRLVERRKPHAAVKRAVAQLQSPPCRAYLEKTGWTLEPLLTVIACLAFKQGAGHQENREILAAALELACRDGKRTGEVADSHAPPMIISVVSPNYRQVENLKLCAASVADQQGSFQHEHLIEDGGSGVEFDEWARKQTFAVCHSQRDNGMYEAINRGFRKAKGDVAAWLNSDEQYLPGALEKVRRYFEEHPDVDILFGDVILVDETGCPLAYRQAVVPTLGHIRTCHLSTFSAATFVRSSVLKAGIFLEERWKIIADAVWVENILSAGFKPGVLNEPLAAFTMLGSNLGQSYKLYQERAAWEAELSHLNRSISCIRERFWHRWKKLMSGSYARRTVTCSLYRVAGAPRRSCSASIGGRWEQAKEKAGKLRDLREGMFGNHQWMRTWSNSFLSVVVSLLVFGVIAVEIQFTVAVVAPFLLATSMMFLSFRCRPRQMIVIAIIFAAIAGWALLGMQNFRIEILIVRLLTFVVTSILAVLWTIGLENTAQWAMSTVSFIRKMPNPFILVDASGRIIMVNAACQKMYGIQEEQLLLQSIQTYLPEDLPTFSTWGQRPPEGAFALLIPAVEEMAFQGEIFSVGRKKRQIFGIAVSVLPSPSGDPCKMN